MQDQNQWQQLTAKVRLEAEQGVVQAHGLLRRLRRQPRDRAVLHELAGIVHRLKGSAGLLGLTEAIRLAHEFEELMLGLEQGDVWMDQVLLNVCGICLDRLAKMIQAKGDTPDAPMAVGELVGAYYEVPATRLERLGDKVTQLGQSVSRARSHALARHDPVLESAAAQVECLVQSIEEEVEELGCARLEDILLFFQDRVRNLNDRLGKEVRFQVEAGDIEVRWRYVGQLQEILSPLILNALDHGIERPDQRRAAGKSDRATLRLQAQREGETIHIRIYDDGRGIDTSALVERAAQMGLSPTCDGQVLDLVFEPGLSTAGTASLLSGRGQGMAEAWRIVSGLGGILEVETVSGQGCCIHIHLPLTLCRKA